MLGCAQLPVHPQHIEKMEELGGLEDWDFIDKYIRGPGILNHDALNLPYKDNSVEVVYASHLLEHLGFKEVQSALVEWKRVLKPGGFLFINVPDLEWLARELVNQSSGNEATSEVFYTPQKLMEVIYGNQDHEGEYHKSGFTKDILTNILNDLGFKDANVKTIWDAHDMNVIIATAKK